MRKLLPETIRRREETKRRMEECRREWDNAMSRLDALCCKTPQDPYSDERDCSMRGEGMDGNIHNLRDALEWLDRSIREEAELDGEMSNEHAIQLGFITNMLEKFPLRQCDVGTAEEQADRFEAYCDKHICNNCPILMILIRNFSGIGCRFAWAQMPYEAQEGGAK